MEKQRSKRWRWGVSKDRIVEPYDCKIYKQGNLRGDKIKYPDGIGCCVWYPLKTKGKDEETSICFDFSYSDIDDFIKLLKDLKKAKAIRYEATK